MRFARQASIFRGPVDPAPVVAVLFLLVIFMLLGSLLYTPGVLIKFEGSALPDTQIVTVTGDNTVVFRGTTYQRTELDQLREVLKGVEGNEPFRFRPESGADPKFVEQVRGLFPVQLPEGDDLTATDNPTVVVAVNFRGQCFYENRQVEDAELKSELRARCAEAARDSKKLTLVLWADKAVENDVVMRVYRLARDAGISEFLMAERPAAFGASRRPRS
jgi:biopolymer transport protein ExbD